MPLGQFWMPLFSATGRVRYNRSPRDAWVRGTTLTINTINTNVSFQSHHYFVCFVLPSSIEIGKESALNLVSTPLFKIHTWRFVREKTWRWQLTSTALGTGTGDLVIWWWGYDKHWCADYNNAAMVIQDGCVIINNAMLLVLLTHTTHTRRFKRSHTMMVFWCLYMSVVLSVHVCSIVCTCP